MGGQSVPPGGFELFGSSSNCGSCIEGWQFEFEFGFECDYEIGRSCNRTWRGGQFEFEFEFECDDET